MEYLDWEKLWPAEGYLITEDGADYVTSQDGNKVKVAKIKYNLTSESGKYINSEAGARVEVNGKL